MKTSQTLAAAAVLTLLATAASAGTLSGAMTTLNGVSAVTNPPKITAAGQIIQLKHSMGVLYYGPDKNPNFTCYAKLEYSDGTASEMVPVKYPAEGVARMRQYTKPGKYTVSLTGTAYNGQVGCLGSASTSFTIEDGLPPVAPSAPVAKKGLADGAGMTTAVTPQGLEAAQGMTRLAPKPPSVPAPNYGSFISKITAVEKTDTWEIMVHGAGDASCNYHVRTWILPQMSIFGEQAMVYEKNTFGSGKGLMTVAKQGLSNVLVETVETAEDTVGNKGCLGMPKLELKPTPPPVLPPQPKKGMVMKLSVAKATYAVGEAIPSVLTAQGDACSFVLRIRPLPFVEYNNDVVFAAHTKSLNWDLSNLGNQLTPGKWTVISQPGTEALAPGDIRCEIAPTAGSGQVFFTVVP